MIRTPTVKEMSDYTQNNLCKNINGTEIMPYCSGSRFDVIEIYRVKRRIKVYEIKSCRQDFTSDNKWEKYLKYCTNFGFVAPPGVISIDELPKKVGLVEIYKQNNGELSHNYIRSFGRINKNVDRVKYLRVLEGFASGMAWRFQEMEGRYKESAKENNRLAKALAKMYFAYLNKDEHCPHGFEKEAEKLAKPIIEEHGGLKKLLKENDS